MGFAQANHVTQLKIDRHLFLCIIWPTRSCWPDVDYITANSDIPTTHPFALSLSKGDPGHVTSGFDPAQPERITPCPA
jgi:hypothetical protein